MTSTTTSRTPATSAHAPARVHRAPVRALAVALALAAVALATVPARVDLYRAAAGGAEGSPLAGLVGLVAEQGLLVLVATAGALALATWARARARFWTLAAGGAGAALAYGASEAVKVLVGEPRPCDVVDVATVLACPPAGDWSWPSNHAVIAGAIAAACVLAVPRAAVVAVPAALAVAASRVGAGVHYVHDVAAGLALGVLVVAAVVAVVRRRAPRTGRVR
jgi:undecaprenyl-diphosphatase